MGLSSKFQWFLLLLVPLVLVMVYINLVSPTKEKQAAAEEDLHKKQQELQMIKTKLEGSAGLAGKERVQLDRVRGIIPEAPYVESLLRDFRMLEVVSGLRMESYNIQVADAAAPAATGAGAEQPPAWSMLALPIKMTTVVKGDYPQIHRMLGELKTTGRMIQVESVSFSASTAFPVKLNTPKQEITSTITFVAYYAPGLSKFYPHAVPTDYAKPPGRTNPIY